MPGISRSLNQEPEIALAEGASEELFETLLIEMMKQGLEARKENVRTLMKQ